MINKEIAWDNIKVFIGGKEITGITGITGIVTYEIDEKNIKLLKKEYKNAYNKAKKNATDFNENNEFPPNGWMCTH